MSTNAVSSRTVKAFPLKYFVLAFAFTWFFWWLAVLGERGAISTLPGLTVTAPSARWWQPLWSPYKKAEEPRYASS